MTSGRCFFRVLREDLRHKIWMLALSTLGSLLALPVTYLIYSGERNQYLRRVSEDLVLGVLRETAYRIESFYGVTVCCLAGAVAVLGAFIVGLFGFRYVFQRNMTDLYHSLPVSRKTLFLAGWLNGFLIWFVPYLINLAVTVLLGEYKLAALKRQAQLQGNLSWEAWPTGGAILADALISTLTILAAFLLVYHLVLLAVMLCGNILNTLTVAGILGAGTTIAWGIVTMLRETYLDTFYAPWGTELRRVSLTSPLVSAVFVLSQRVQFFEKGGYHAWRLVISLLTAAVLWLLAFVIYQRRRSELADQGMAGKTIRFILQIGVSLAAACGGWLLFWALASYSGMIQLVWSIFGGILAGGIVFGVLDVIFNMDFKAFFRHKGLMAGVLAAGVLIGLALRFDWLGYDEYLPEKEEIAEISISSDILSNRWDLGGSLALDEVPIRDQEAAYAFLESAVAVQRRMNGEHEDTSDYSEHIETKVTLKSGRSYYRTYLIYSKDSGPIRELMMAPEYLESRYRISDEAREAFTGITLRRGNVAYETEKLTREDRQRIDRICEAYNRDLEENPEMVVFGEGRMFASISLAGSRWGFRLGVYEGMTNTREALRQSGLAYYADPVEAEEVERIILNSGVSIRDLTEEYDLAGNVREMYGLTDREKESGGPQSGEVSRTPEESEKGVAESRAPQEQAESVGGNLPLAQTTGDLSIMDGNVELEITDSGEIEELLELLSYSSGRTGRLFGAEEQIYGGVRILEKSGNQYDVYIASGSLPEKYILRFEQAGEEILRQRNP